MNQYGVEDRYTFCDAAWDAAGAYQLASRYGWFCIQGTGENAFQHPRLNARGQAVGMEWRLFSKIRDVAVGATKARLIMLATDRLKDIMTTLRDGKSLEWLIPADIQPLYMTQIQGEVKRERSIRPPTDRCFGGRWLGMAKTTLLIVNT